jgi:hypothetical protein
VVPSGKIKSGDFWHSPLSVFCYLSSIISTIFYLIAEELPLGANIVCKALQKTPITG